MLTDLFEHLRFHACEHCFLICQLMSYDSHIEAMPARAAFSGNLFGELYGFLPDAKGGSRTRVDGLFCKTQISCLPKHERLRRRRQKVLPPRPPRVAPGWPWTGSGDVRRALPEPGLPEPRGGPGRAGGAAPGSPTGEFRASVWDPGGGWGGKGVLFRVNGGGVVFWVGGPVGVV